MLKSVCMETRSAERETECLRIHPWVLGDRLTCLGDEWRL